MIHYLCINKFIYLVLILLVLNGVLWEILIEMLFCLRNFIRMLKNNKFLHWSIRKKKPISSQNFKMFTFSLLRFTSTTKYFTLYKILLHHTCLFLYIHNLVFLPIYLCLNSFLINYFSNILAT